MGVSKKKKKSTGKRRKSRVGAIGKSDMTTAAGVIGGVIAAKLGNQVIKKQFSTMDTKLAAGIPGAVGALVLLLGSKVKALNSPFVKGAAMGMIGGSAASLASELGMLSGIGESFTLRRRVAGPTSNQFIGQSGNNTTYDYDKTPFIGSSANSTLDLRSRRRMAAM